MATYSIKIGDLTRELPLTNVNPDLAIASFVILGDCELVCHVAPLLAEKLPDADFLVEQLHSLPIIIGNERQAYARRLHLCKPRHDALVRLGLLVRSERIVNIHDQHVNATLL